jgi:hypothetical protein
MLMVIYLLGHIQIAMSMNKHIIANIDNGGDFFFI